MDQRSTEKSDRVAKEEFKSLTLFRDETDVLRVGGRMTKGEVSCDTKHAVLLPNTQWITHC